MSEKFIPNKLALITLIAASSVILVSMGLRQTFGLFFSAFEQGLNCSRTEFGLAIGLQMLFWGIFAPIFGVLADKFGGNKAVFIGFIIFGLGMPGGWEWIIIGLIVVIFFGANKIPEIFRGFGKGIREFKDASREIKKEIEKESKSDSDKK